MRELISLFGPYLKDFYEYKQLCGYKYEKSESYCFLFDRYYSSLNLKELKFSRDIIEPFLELKENERIGNQVARASFLRQFGKYLFINNVLDNIYLIPSITKKGESEYIPYIFSSEHYKKIVEYIDTYSYPNVPGGFIPYQNMINSVSTAIKILMTTGMRLGEVLNLKLSDIDLDRQIFYIKEAKNNNQRIIPFSNTIKLAIQQYLKMTPFTIENNDYLLQSKENNQLKRYCVTYYYRKSLKFAGIEHIKGKGPRIHDFRHTFAVMSLTQLQKSEKNINLSLTYLSTYLGHKSLKETQKYIWLTPSLFNDIKNKMSDYSKFIIDIFQEEKFDED